MKIDHIGYAVRDIGKAERYFALLGFAFEPTVSDTDRNVQIAFGANDSYRIELVAPGTQEGGSPVDSILEKFGPSPYHICYKSADLEADIEQLQHSRFKVTIPPAPAKAFGGKRVVFLYSLQAGLIEIVEE